MLRIGLNSVLPATVCGYRPQDNLANATYFRIQDFPYLLVDSSLSPGCSLVQVEDPVAGNVLGSILGWHAAGIDLRLEDSAMGVRPTNALYVAAVRQYLSYAWQAGAGGFLAPFFCLGNIISGDGCDVGGGFELATRFDPVKYGDGWIPTIGAATSEDYTGVWHYMRVNTPGQYNDIRGLLYDSAGPDGRPGAADVAIMIASDTAGISLNALESDGDDRYEPADAVKRTVVDWQATTISHLEFNPLDGLAQYGWRLYHSESNRAGGLGWPLHALGDATEPHHLAGTSAWGHRPYEDAVEELLGQMLTMSPEQLRTILVQGFTWWSLFCTGGDVPIRDLVTAVAHDASFFIGPWAWNDGASLQYSFKDVDSGAARAAIRQYTHMQNFALYASPLLEKGAAGMLALLTGAAGIATDPGLNPSISCSADTFFDGYECAQGTAPVPSGVDAAPVELRPTCHQEGQDCSALQPCCGSLVCDQNVCVEPACRPSAKPVQRQNRVANGLVCASVCQQIS